MSAHLAALALAFLVVVGVGIFLLANIPLFYAACGVVALVVLLAAGRPRRRPRFACSLRVLYTHKEQTNGDQ